MTGPGLTRRGLLGRSAGLAGMLAAGACRQADGTGDDLAGAARAAGAERLVVEHYRSTSTLAAQGRLGAAIPEAFIRVVTTATVHHQDHLDAWTTLLAGAGRSPGAAPVGMGPAMELAAGRVTDVPAAATMALRLEDYLAQTYLALVPSLRAPAAITLAGQMLIVDAQHQAVLRYLVGLPPVGSGVARDAADLAPAEPRLALISG